MKREFKVEANVGAPQVAYRETLENASEVEYTHKKQSGGAGQFAKVKLLVEPQEPGAGRSVESKIKGGAIPKEFIPGVEKGIETVSDTGILCGFPMIDYKVTILDGLHHDVDSSVLAFELAGRACFKEACTKGTLKLLEPVMRVEVVTPEDYMGDVIGDLNSRRGQISTQEQRGNATVITAMVPLANMFGYINNLRSMSQGRAQYSMFFDHYSKVPQNVQDEVTKKIAG
jgi:elongation factor G